MTYSGDDCDYFNLSYLSLPNGLCTAINALKDEQFVLTIFFIFLVYMAYYKIRGRNHRVPKFYFPRIYTMKATRSFERFIIIMFFATLLFFVMFY